MRYGWGLENRLIVIAVIGKQGAIVNNQISVIGDKKRLRVIDELSSILLEIECLRKRIHASGKQLSRIKRLNSNQLEGIAILLNKDEGNGVTTHRSSGIEEAIRLLDDTRTDAEIEKERGSWHNG